MSTRSQQVWGPPMPGSVPPRVLRKPWGLGDAWAGLGIGIGLSTAVALVVAIVAIYPGLQDGDSVLVQSEVAGLTTSGPLLVGGLLALWVGLVAAPVWASRRKGARSLATDFGLTFRPVDLVIGPVVGAALVGLSFGVEALLSLTGLPSGDNTSMITDVRGVGWLAVLLLGTALGAPVVEELFFRGLVLRALQRRFTGRRGTVLSVAITTVLFGVLHGSTGVGAISTVLETALLGVVLAVLAVRTGRLGASIGAHMTNNAVSVVLALVLR